MAAPKLSHLLCVALLCLVGTQARVLPDPPELGRKLLQSPSPAPYPCTVGDAACFCKWKAATGTFADVAVGCQKYYECVSATQNYYRLCSPGLLFSDVSKNCDWPANVKCSATAAPPSPPAAKSPPPVAAKSPPPPAAKSPPPPAAKSPPPPAAKSPPPPAAKSPPPPAKSPPPPAAKSPPPPVASPSPSPSPAASPSPSPLPSPAASPSPSPSGDAYPCAAGDAACFCAWRAATGMFADTKAGCQSYYWCVAAGSAYYRACGAGLLFNDAQKACDWDYNVKCTPAPPAPSPPPSPPPSPAPSPSPPAPPLSPPAPPGSGKLFAAYFESWRDPWTSDPAKSTLANLPPYVNVVILSFMFPDTTYTGGVTWQGTGMGFSSDAAVVKDSIALLKRRNPGTKVLVAVGGATYTAFDKLNAPAIASFVKAFGLDGVDLDYEPTNAACKVTAGVVSCATDAEYIASVKTLRAALPRPLMLTTATWSIGAYGEGAFAAAQPQGQYTGVALKMLKAVGDQLDLILLMSYDASNAYDPKQALDAYRAYYSGPVAMGWEVANEAWGGHVISLPEASSLADYVVSTGGAGLMLWSLQKRADAGPTGEQLAQLACQKLGLQRCTCGFNCPPLA